MGMTKVSKTNWSVLAEIFPKTLSLRKFSPFTFDAVPISFSYDRIRRRVRFTIGIELERLLGLEVPLEVGILVPYTVSIRLPPAGKNLHFKESVSLNLSESAGQGIFLEKVNSKAVGAVLNKRHGLFSHGKGVLVRFSGLEFSCFVRKSSDVGIRLSGTDQVPRAIVIGKQRVLDSESGRSCKVMSMTELIGHLRRGELKLPSGLDS